MTFEEFGIACPGLPPAEPVSRDYAARVVTALRNLGFDNARVVTREGWHINGLQGLGFVYTTWEPTPSPPPFRAPDSRLDPDTATRGRAAVRAALHARSTDA